MRTKILILQEYLFANTDANSKLVFRICIELKQRGYDVSVLGIAHNKSEHVNEYQGIHLIHKPDERATSTRNLKQRLGRFHWLRYILRPRSIGYRVNNTYTPFYLETKWWLKRHVHEYDALIACCSPYYPLALASEVATKIPVIYYKIDPVGSWISKSRGDEILSTIGNEIKWDNVASRIIMSDVVYKDYMRLPTKVNGHKVVIAQFPNVRRLQTINGQNPEISNQLSVISGQCNVLFTGRFYADIRHPQYLFDLMKKLEGLGIVLHIVGPIANRGFDKAYIEKYFTNKIPNIRFHGAVPPREADALLTQADVLVHVGNAVDSLMPSKILDYISSGKPILNICKIRNCPTLPLMERYPIGLTIFEDEGISDLVSERVKEFCLQNKGKQVPYEQIEKLYPECTIEYVGKQFDDTIQAAINEFKQK